MVESRQGELDPEFEGPIDTATFFSNVLLIEDEPAHAKLIMRALRGIVGDIVHASSGKEAYEALSSAYADLVLCDLNLPDTNALHIIETLKRVRPGLPVIVVTSSADIDTAVTAIHAGALDYAVKQFSGDMRSHLRLVIEKAAERKLLQIRQAKMRSRHRVLSAAALAAQDGLAILGSGASIVFENAAFRNFKKLLLAEYDPASFPTFVDLIALHDYQAARAFSEQLTRGETLWTSEICVAGIREDAKEVHFFFELTLSSVQVGALDDLGIAEGVVADMRQYVVWVRDITRRREQERFQRDLLSTTTHDLKGPLGAIINSSELLDEVISRDEERAHQLTTRIASCARNAISLIDELLSARRIQDGVLVIRPRKENVRLLLDDIILDYFPVAKAKSIELRASPAGAELEVYADKLGIVRVLGNLVGNALKFTPRGGKVELSAERSGHEVRISVSDTGPGIPAHDRHILFERYGRLETTRTVEGTGLGLFVAKNIIDAHNGRIEVVSEVGKGTVFTVILPDAAQSA